MLSLLHIAAREFQAEKILDEIVKLVDEVWDRDYEMTSQQIDSLLTAQEELTGSLQDWSVQDLLRYPKVIESVSLFHESLLALERGVVNQDEVVLEIAVEKAEQAYDLVSDRYYSQGSLNTMAC